MSPSHGGREPALRVLGIDPGSEKTGWGVVDRLPDGLLQVRGHGVIRTRSGDPLAQRLARIHGGLAAVIAEHRPQVAAVERVFVSRFPQAALILGHARGVALLAAVGAGLTVVEYTPAEIEQAAVGTGRGQKHQVSAMMVRLLGLPEAPAEDAGDALAVAVCHATRRVLPGLTPARPAGRAR